MNEAAVWGDFEVRFDQILGRGGMGTVYRGLQRSLGRPVAVKVLDLSRASDPELIEGCRQKFRNEAMAMALVDDPRIVRVLGAGENDGRCWYAMELVEGRTVDRRLSEEGAFPEAEAVRVALEVARALEVVLRRGIVHRDVKPGNIFLLPDGAVKLGDFGLARGPGFARTRLTEANAVACTPAYAAPEHAEGRPSDHRADIYSLGCVLYEMLTERPPFAGDLRVDTLFLHASEPPLPPRLLNPRISTSLERVILKCLEKDPADRYQTYGELIRVLEARPSAVSPGRGERFWPAAAAAGAALLGALLVAIYTARPPSLPEGRAVPPSSVVRLPEPPEMSPGPPVPAPVVKSPEPGDFPMSPSREETPEFLLAHHRPTDEELRDLERFLASSRASLPERMGFRFDGALKEFREQDALTPWVAILAAAERERIEAADRVWSARRRFQEGQEVVIPLRRGGTAGGILLGEDGVGLMIEAPGGGRRRVPWREVSPDFFFPDPLARSAAGDAAGVLEAVAAMPEYDRLRYAPGIVDQSIEEVLTAAGAGNFRPLQELEIPAGLRASVEGLLGERLRRLERERAAALLLACGEIPGVLKGHPGTLAAARAAGVALEDFLKSLPADADHELVGEIPWGSWTVGGSARFDGPSRTYVLVAPGGADRSWLSRKFRGARSGYRVVFRFGDGSEETTVFVMAFSSSCWMDVRRGSAALFRIRGGGDMEGAGRVDFAVPLTGGGTLTVVPRDSLVLVYLDGRLLFVMPEAEVEGGIRLGGGGGTLIVESIRVRDRKR